MLESIAECVSKLCQNFVMSCSFHPFLFLPAGVERGAAAAAATTTTAAAVGAGAGGYRR